MANDNKAVLNSKESYFDGGYFAYIGYNLLVGFVTTITFGIAFPWMCCLLQKWKAKHTVVCGKRMYFDGTGVQLIGKFLLWMLLTIITFGIYGFWMVLAVKKWVCKHTHFEGEEDNNSYFDGNIWGFIGTNILAGLVVIVPFVGFAWSIIIRTKWEMCHTVTDSRRLIFVGTVGSLFLKYLLWGFLTVITFGIFSFFIPVKQMRWEAENTIDNENTTEELIKQSEYRTNIHTDAATLKTYEVENEMEGMKVGITDAISEEELLGLANRGIRVAQYEYVVRYAGEQYGVEPFCSMLKASADAGYAPAMNLYAQIPTLEEEVRKEFIIRAAGKGQVWSMKEAMRFSAEEGLGLKDSKKALPVLERAVRYGDLLKESGASLTNEEKFLKKKCIFAIRRIKSASKPTSGGGAVAAIILAILIGIPLVLGLTYGIQQLLTRGMMGNVAVAETGDSSAFWASILGGYDKLPGYEDDVVETMVGQEDADVTAAVVEPVSGEITTSEFWSGLSGQLELDHYVITEMGSDGYTTTYQLTCNYWYWSSEYYIDITDENGILGKVYIYGNRVIDPSAPDPTINQMEILDAIRRAYKYLGLGELDEITPYEEPGYHGETYGGWQFYYENDDTQIRVTIARE